MLKNKNFYKGAIHIHSNQSDGTGTIDEISLAAKKAGLDFIIITDHNYIDSNEGYINGVCVIKGEEISPKDCNHYLAFGIDTVILPDEKTSVYVDAVRRNGGFGFAAHPDEGVNKNGEKRKNSHHCIPWTNKNIKPDGVEIWNWFSNWADNLNDKTIFNLAYSYLYKHKICTPPSKCTLEWWDKLNNESSQIVPAIGGVDAHALKLYRYIIPVTVFPYAMCFKTITNVIYLQENLSEDFKTAKEQILNALKKGNNVIFNRHICEEVPQIYVTVSNTTHFCGENINLNKDCYIHFLSKNIMDIFLIYNGEVLERYTSDKLVYPITKSGKYRLEVYYKGKGYLYTNPFNIKE